mgnify:FL=1
MKHIPSTFPRERRIRRALLAALILSLAGSDSRALAESAHRHSMGEQHAEHEEAHTRNHKEDHDPGRSLHEHDGDEPHGNHASGEHGEVEHEDHDAPGHEDHDAPGHEDHGEAGHEKSRAVDVPPPVLEEFGIEVHAADGGTIAGTLRLSGEVVYNADSVVHVSPAVSGIVQKVMISVGDEVRAGDAMAVLNSRELAAARNDYLAARARLRLAEENLKRDRRLFQDKIGSERAFLESRQAFREAEITLQQAESTLQALGYSQGRIEQVPTIDDDDFNLYSLKAPITGTVTQRHLTLGEQVAPSSEAPFVVADLSTLWVNLTVYQRDLSQVRAGQPVQIRFKHGIPDTESTIDFVSPSLEESTRTAFARVVIGNPDGRWRPGMFIEGILQTGHDRASVVVPRSAIIGIDGRPVVFIRTANGFMPQPVKLGRTTEERAEILEGLNAGDHYAATNVLTLKAEYNSAALEHAGHAH